MAASKKSQAEQPAQVFSDADTALAAAESIDRLAQQFRNMVRAAEVLREVGTLANTKRELEASIGLLREQVAIHESTAITAAESARAAETEAARVLEQSRADALAARQAAEQQAAEILSAARDEANRIAAQSAATAASATETLEGRRSTLTAEIAAHTATLNELAAAVEAKHIELAAVESKVTQARAAAAAIFGEQA